MNRVPLVLALAFGLLLALSGVMEAQAIPIPPKTQPARKAKKVWTNDDLPERPAAKAAKAQAAPPKAEAKGAKPEKPGAGASPEELLKELEKMEEEPLRRLAELLSQRDVAWEEYKTLEKERDSAPSAEAQGALNAQLREKRIKLGEIMSQMALVESALEEIRQKKAALLPPFEGDFGVSKAPPQPAKEKEEPKPAPPK